MHARTVLAAALGLLGCERANPPKPPKQVTSADVRSAEEALARGDRARAIELFARACARGDQHACARQGFYLIADTHAPELVAQAVKLWTTACDSVSDPLACSNLGSFYFDGEGVPEDRTRAAGLWVKACDGDDNFACGAAATSFALGQGVPVDRERGYAFADKGCKLDSPSACTSLGLALVEGWHGDRDFERAVQLFRGSCARNDRPGCFQLGLALRDGRGVATDPAQARSYLERACIDDAFAENCKRELATLPPSTTPTRTPP